MEEWTMENGRDWPSSKGERSPANHIPLVFIVTVIKRRMNPRVNYKSSIETLFMLILQDSFQRFCVILGKFNGGRTTGLPPKVKVHYAFPFHFSWLLQHSHDQLRCKFQARHKDRIYVISRLCKTIRDSWEHFNMRRRIVICLPWKVKVHRWTCSIGFDSLQLDDELKHQFHVLHGDKIPMDHLRIL